MTKTCSSCGTASNTYARFCRLCGAPFHSSPTSGSDTDAPISPLAETVPLAEDGRATGPLSVDDPHHTAPETSKVSRLEMENLLRRPSIEDGVEKFSGHADAAPQSAMDNRVYAAIPTVMLTATSAQEETTARAVSQSTPTAAPRRRRWFVVITLVLTLVGSLFAFLVLRLRTLPQNTNAASITSVDNEPAPAPSVITKDRDTAKDTAARNNNFNAQRNTGRQESAPAAAVPPAPSQQSTRLSSTAPPTVASNNRNATVTAQNNFDSFYIQGLSVLNERDPKTVPRAELLRALKFFQLAAQGGTHQAQAKRYAKRLDSEYGRLLAKDKH